MLWVKKEVLEGNTMNTRSRARKAKVFVSEHVILWELKGFSHVILSATFSEAPSQPPCHLQSVPLLFHVRTSVSEICDVRIPVCLCGCSISLPLDCETYDVRDQGVLVLCWKPMPTHLSTCKQQACAKYQAGLQLEMRLKMLAGRDASSLRH